MELRGYFEGVDPFVDIFFEECVEPTKVLVDTGFTGELMLPGDDSIVAMQYDSLNRLMTPLFHP